MIQFKLEDDPVYAGSKLFAPLADKTGVPIDKLNFLIAQLAALLLAIIYRSYIATNVKSDTVKYLAVLIPGFLLGYFEFGYQIWNLWTMATISYILIKSCNPDIVQDIVFSVSIFYLSYLHLRRQLNSNGSYVVDITVPTMIVVQKISSLAYSVHDGMANRKSLSQDQQRLAITEVPTLLQFFSYVFQFPTLLAGPMFYFNDFVGYIEGTTESEYLSQKKALPSYKLVALQKLCISFFFMFLMVYVEPMFPISKIIDEKFLNESSALAILFYIYLSTTCQRFKYYGAWKLGEAVSITSGFGLIKNNSNEFEYISSVDIIGFEFATSFRNCLAAWNITTQNWLRRVSYERCEDYKLAKTYILSAVWHGFYPGYYMTFLSGGVFTSASRVARKYVRPLFQANEATQLLYDLITFFVTKLMLTYIVFPFVILEFTSSFRVYTRLWFSGHILLILISALPILLKARNGQRETQSDDEKSN